MVTADAVPVKLIAPEPELPPVASESGTTIWVRSGESMSTPSTPVTVSAASRVTLGPSSVIRRYVVIAESSVDARPAVPSVGSTRFAAACCAAVALFVAMT